MRALTLKPWWAHAVAHLGKRCENRSRRIPPARMGERIAIHAGVCESGAAIQRGVDAVTSYEPRTRISFTYWPYENPIVWRDGEWPVWNQLATRSIVATAVLAQCSESTEIDTRDYATRPPWLRWADRDAAFWWKLEDVVTLAEPVHYRVGQLGLWTLSESIVARLEP